MPEMGDVAELRGGACIKAGLGPLLILACQNVSMHVSSPQGTTLPGMDPQEEANCYKMSRDFNFTFILLSNTLDTEFLL